MHTAIFFRRPRCLQLLLQAGSSIVSAYPEKINLTILLAVARIRNTPVGSIDAENVVKVLLETEEGKDALNAIDPDTKASAVVRCIGSSSETSKAGEDNSIKVDALARVLNLLLEAGASQELSNIPGSAVGWACSIGVPNKIVDLLLQYGADPDSGFEEFGVNCLASALAKRQVDNVKTLLEHGANINAR